MTRITPLILAVALFMENMDATVIATSLPAIAADIGAEPVSLKLALTAYLVALAIFIPISGWVADRFGARNVFRGAIAVFVVGSIACAFAWSLESFVVARFVQGMGGAMMTPLARLVLVRATPRNQLVNAMAWLTIPALTGPLLGPPVGGFLTTYLSWHWIFWINVPIGIAGIVLSGIYLPQTERYENPPIDYRGFLLIGLAFAGIVFGLSVISLPALPPLWGVLTTVLGIFALGLYVAHARRTAHPLLDLTLFRNTEFRAAVTGMAVFLIGVGAIPFLFPLMLQLGFGMTPFESGMIIFVAAVGALVMKFFAQALFERIGFRTVLAAAAILSSVLIVAKGMFTPATPIWIMLLVLFVAGLIRSSFFTGVNAFAFASINDRQAAQATAIATVARPLATALGVALAGGILELSSRMHGDGIALIDFRIAFITVAVVASASVLPFLRLAADAGSAVSGHRIAVDPVLDAGSTPEAPLEQLKDAEEKKRPAE